LAVAARLSGASQDKELKDSEKLASQADVEITRIKALKQSAPGRTASSVLVDNGMGQLPLDKLLAKLETIKLAAKDQVRLLLLRSVEDSRGRPSTNSRINANLSQLCLRFGLLLLDRHRSNCFFFFFLPATILLGPCASSTHPRRRGQAP
jgi:hypothetical protein